jgi:hypothetical protein
MDVGTIDGVTCDVICGVRLGGETTHSVTIPAKKVSDWLYIYPLRRGQPISAEISP